MPSNITINIECPTYLISFFESLYGKQPIALPKKENWSAFLRVNLHRVPDDFKLEYYGENNLAILLPYFEDFNVNHKFCLSKLKQGVFADTLEASFLITFRRQIDKTLKLNLDITKKDCIYMFIEDYNLSENCYDMLIRNYSRYRKTQRMHYYRNPENMDLISSV